MITNALYYILAIFVGVLYYTIYVPIMFLLMAIYTIGGLIASLFVPGSF